MYKIYFICSLILLQSCAIDFNHIKFYRNLNAEKQKEYKLTPPDSVSRPAENIYSINSKEFLTATRKDTVDFKLIVFYTNWCSESEAFLPGFIDELKRHGNKPVTFFISPDDWVYKYDYLSYAKKVGLNSPVYLLDVYTYGDKRNPHYRMRKFISEICTDCEEIAGFPSLILFNKENKVVFKKTGAVSFDTIIGVINENKSP